MSCIRESIEVVHRRSRYVSVWLVAASVSLGAGCVVPMPIESIGEQVNLPPYHLSAYMEPLNNQIIEFNPEEESGILLRTGPIGDPNPNDRIFFRWFLDYRPATSNFPIESSEASGSVPEQLIDGIQKELRPCAAGTSQLLSDDPVHRVELLVADRPFVTSESDDPQPRQTLPSDAQSFSVVWFIRFDRTRCQ